MRLAAVILAGSRALAASWRTRLEACRMRLGQCCVTARTGKGK
jgi:hypothetical protein